MHPVVMFLVTSTPTISKYGSLLPKSISANGLRATSFDKEIYRIVREIYSKEYENVHWRNKDGWALLAFSNLSLMQRKLSIKEESK